MCNVCWHCMLALCGEGMLLLKIKSESRDGRCPCSSRGRRHRACGLGRCFWDGHAEDWECTYTGHVGTEANDAGVNNKGTGL